MKYEIAAGSLGQNAVLVAIDEALIPIVAGRLNTLLQSGVWNTRDDYERGYNAVGELLSQMANNYLERIVTATEYTARVLDTSLNGTPYTVGEGGAVTPFPPVPPVSTDAPNAARAHLGRLWRIAENAHTGATSAAGAGVEGSPELPVELSWAARLLALQGTQGGFFGLGDAPVTLKDLLQAGRVNTPTDEGLIPDGIQEVLGTVQDTTGIGGILSQFFATAADVATDGGVVATQLVTGVGTLAAIAAQTAAIDTLNRQLSTLNVALFGFDSEGQEGPLPVVPGANGALRPIVRTVGDVETVAGLGEYLVGRFGQTGSTSVQAALLAIGAALVSNPGGETAANLLAALGTATGGATEATLQAILTAVGPITESPLDVSVRGLLDGIQFQAQRQADCCEEGSGGGGAPVNEQPAFVGDCNTNPAATYRVQQVIDLGETTGGDPPASRMWGYVLNWAGDDPIQTQQFSNGAPIYRIGGEPGTEVQVCWGWNFTGEDAAKTIGFDAGHTLTEADSRQWSPGGDLPLVGTATATLTVGDDPGQVRFIGPRAEYDATRVPSENVWFKIYPLSEF